MIILALDTVLENCSVALLQNGVVLAASSQHIGKGHAEYLPAQIEDVMQKAGISWGMIERIAVNIGPGSFTGIRVGVSTARGLALALKKPAIGINNLEALAFEAHQKYPDHCVSVMQNGALDHVYAAHFDENGVVSEAPYSATLEEVGQKILPSSIVTGSAAAPFMLQNSQPDLTLFDKNLPDIATIGLIGAMKDNVAPPSPLYLRAPDAKPQSGFALPREG